MLALFVKCSIYVACLAHLWPSGLRGPPWLSFLVWLYCFHDVLSLLPCSDIIGERYRNRSAIDDIIRHGFFVSFQTAVAVHCFEYCTRFACSLFNVIQVTGFVWTTSWPHIFLDSTPAIDHILGTAFLCFSHFCLAIYLVILSFLNFRLAYLSLPVLLLLLEESYSLWEYLPLFFYRLYLRVTSRKFFCVCVSVRN